MSRKPDPPAGKGPVLAWHQANARWKVGLFLVSVALIAGGLILIQLINGNSTPFEVLAYWQVWVVVLVGSLLITRPLTYTRLSAGADWCQLQMVRFGVTRQHQVVDLYDLHRVEVDTGPTAWYLKVVDDTGVIDLARVEWQDDRRIWDLVYNGILHSVAAGAETNRKALALLDIPVSLTEPAEPASDRTIDLMRLSDAHVWQLMEDPALRALCTNNEYYGSARRFRRRFPTVTESMLANPTNPDWFTDMGEDPEPLPEESPNTHPHEY